MRLCRGRDAAVVRRGGCWITIVFRPLTDVRVDGTAVNEDSEQEDGGSDEGEGSLGVSIRC